MYSTHTHTHTHTNTPHTTHITHARARYTEPLPSSQAAPVVKLTKELAKAGREADLDWAIDHWGGATVIEWADARGQTLLHWACSEDNPSRKSVKTLLELGADPNRGDRYNRTPLHVCAHNGTAERQEIARHLIDHGANRLLKDQSGNTPLSYAHGNGYTEMARLLEEYVASAPAAAQGPGQVRPPCPLLRGQ